MCPDLSSMLCYDADGRDLHGLGAPIGRLVEIGALRSLLIGIVCYAAIGFAGFEHSRD